jgi:hypothetical protein
MPPNTVKHLFYFYFFEVSFHKQWVIAADDENAHSLFSGHCELNTNL